MTSSGITKDMEATLQALLIAHSQMVGIELEKVLDIVAPGVTQHLIDVGLGYSLLAFRRIQQFPFGIDDPGRPAIA